MCLKLTEIDFAYKVNIAMSTLRPKSISDNIERNVQLMST